LAIHVPELAWRLVAALGHIYQIKMPSSERTKSAFGSETRNRLMRDERLQSATLLLTAIFGGALGSAITLFSFENTPPRTVEYGDFIAVLLTAIAVILTVFALGIAALTYYGWQGVKNNVETVVKQELNARISTPDFITQIGKSAVDP
jgi:hypothetical protein